MRARRSLVLVAGVLVVLWSPPAQTDVEPVGPEIPVNTFLLANQQSPAIATDASGGFVVVWQSGTSYSGTQDGSQAGIFGRRFDADGAPLTGEIPINAQTAGPQVTPSVATSPGGSFVTAFAGGGYGFDQDGSVSGVFLRRVTGTTPVGTDVQVNTFTRGFQGVPRVAADPTGSFVVVWQSGQYFGATQDGDGAGIFAQRYGAGGVPLGGEFQVNPRSRATSRRRRSQSTPTAPS
jgi:large repetitive protein